MTEHLSLRVLVDYDDENRHWYVVHSDIPGMFIETQTLDEAVEVILDVAPDLVETNLPAYTGDLNAIPVIVQRAAIAARARS